jgi:hypothetical protein
MGIPVLMLNIWDESSPLISSYIGTQGDDSVCLSISYNSYGISYISDFTQGFWWIPFLLEVDENLIGANLPSIIKPLPHTLSFLIPSFPENYSHI